MECCDVASWGWVSVASKGDRAAQAGGVHCPTGAPLKELVPPTERTELPQMLQVPQSQPGSPKLSCWPGEVQAEVILAVHWDSRNT